MSLIILLFLISYYLLRNQIILILIIELSVYKNSLNSLNIISFNELSLGLTALSIYLALIDLLIVRRWINLDILK